MFCIPGVASSNVTVLANEMIWDCAGDDERRQTQKLHKEEKEERNTEGTS